MRSPSTDTGLFTHTDSQPADHFTPHSCADTDTSQEVWIPAQKYSPDQDLKLADPQARRQSKPSVAVGFGFWCLEDEKKEDKCACSAQFPYKTRNTEPESWELGEWSSISLMVFPQENLSQTTG